MRWAELRGALPGARHLGEGEELEVTAVVCDSRQAGPGAVFVAVPGVNVDGHRFLPEALARGAVAAVVEREEGLPAGLPAAVVADSRAALAQLVAAWHGYPGRQLRVVGVTGTEGKTTTVALITDILEAAGLRAGMLSTVVGRVAGQELDTGLHTTTPDAPEVQGYLARMVRAGAQYAVLEVTSHSLAQKRVEACEFDVAALTNITLDHLSYHGSYEAYREAKSLLFRSLLGSARKPGTPKVAVLNVDDPAYSYLRAIPADVCLTYGLQGAADLTLTDVVSQGRGWRACAQTPRGSFEISIPLPGRFNLYNALAAMAVAISQDLPTEAIRTALAGFAGVEGRMQEVDLGQGFRAMIDFAHTPNALAQALTTAREMAPTGGSSPNRIIAVFGCPGERDRFKRAMMGEISGRLADYTVITADDPRSEPVEEIMAEIAEGCRAAGRQEGEHFARIADRAEAIAFAVGLAEEGDVVLLAGKGHERSLAVGTAELPWSDYEVLRAALAASRVARVHPA
jgi:UDP-N-acetylmuramoyl-L-alanyl-D-glutamate--2,6-diaminopimelate ligase